MLEDIFVEGSVAKHPSTGQRMVAYVFIALGILAFFAGFLYPPFMMIGWMIGIAFFVVFYLYNRSLEVDFDYSMTNGVFDVAKVTNKEKRKELCTVDLKEELVLVAPNGHDSLRGYEGKHLRTINAAGSDPEQPVYTMIAKDSKDGSGEYAISFQPDREVLQALHRAKPREVIIVND